jgi:hypothetical protein
MWRRQGNGQRMRRSCAGRKRCWVWPARGGAEGGSGGIGAVGRSVFSVGVQMVGWEGREPSGSHLLEMDRRVLLGLGKALI